MMDKTIINVTRAFLPPIEEYACYLQQIFDNAILTNQGPCLQELESRLKSFLGVKNIHLLSNGTTALQLAMKTLNITEGEVITTPFSYVATISSILWERCAPVFVDIEPNNFTIDAGLLEKSVTSRTKAIMAVHVFGYACDTEAIEKIASKHNLKVIYDAAHAFGSVYEGKSLLNYGDISVCSFHATKLFHTVEGGACIIKDDHVSRRLEFVKRFGHQNDDHICLGINAKNSELHAAMGLANLKYFDKCMDDRKRIFELYNKLLYGCVKTCVQQQKLAYNYSYYPVLFKNEEQLLAVFDVLNRDGIFPRRYFYPSLNKLPYLPTSASCPVSEDISSRIACLPLYVGLSNEDIERISTLIQQAVHG
jgi:dTDP-4-amino-4,6-dideoxygalactose transaminase